MLKVSVIALSLLAPMAATLPLTASAVDVDLVVKVPPPAVRYEARPAARAGYNWVPGYWGYRGGQHTWVAGTWVRERPGYVYQAPTWVQRDGAWHLAAGHYARKDSDHDGVRNARDRDRDGDGVRNNWDAHPNVPGR